MEGKTDPLSMSTDNTPEGRLMSDTVQSGPITLVQEGMKVVDANGDEIGKVDRLKMGDPDAVTTRGQEPTEDRTFLDDLARGIFGENHGLPESIRNDLLRDGFIHVDGKGWFGTNYYAAADQIAGVAGDTVTLAVDKDALPRG